MDLETYLRPRAAPGEIEVMRRGVRVVEHAFERTRRQVALPITFTPFASARPCSARCVFCSETLIHRDTRLLSAALRPSPSYFDGLARALRAVRGLPIGISLSGLEATDDPDWLCATLACVEAHERDGGRIEDKVLYTNAAGLARPTAGDVLVPRLQRFGLTRAEISRHDFRQERNDAIMRFRAGQPIARREVFEETVRELGRALPVRLVCVVQRAGVSSLDDVERYLAWATEVLGVRDVVFRELSRTAGLYRPNATLRRIDDGRVALQDLLLALWPEGGAPRPGFSLCEATQGYYYWNVRFRSPAGALVTFETSDYGVMKERHGSGVVHKLVFHANGNLCADWDPEREVLVATEAA